MNRCKWCGREGRFYKKEPEGYIALQEWAEKMCKTHEQHRCPGCQRYTVWRLK